MATGVNAVIFEGAGQGGRLEEMVQRVRGAALLDNLAKMGEASCFDRVFLSTNCPALAASASRLGAEVFVNEISPADFHFGHALRELVCRHGMKKVFCLNGAGCPLITVDELRMISRRLQESGRLVYTNNTQSSDMVAFTVPPLFEQAELPATDNSLALTLRDNYSLPMALMPHSLGLLFDIDTPTDLLVLGNGPFCGPHIRAALDALSLDYGTLEAAKGVLGDEYEEVALVGRVGAPVIGRLNGVLKLRLRVFSEERGMKALGRVTSGEVVSLLALLLDHAGLPAFFQGLARVARCAFIDSRVLFYHYRLDPPAEERFLSDLGLWQEIRIPWIREFTRLAVESDIPILLGGHSLVAGSLWALCEELGAGKDPL